MSRSLSPWRAVLLGVVLLAGLALGVGGLFLIGGRGWYGDGAFHVRAGFREVRGVGVGTRVRLKGMDAGEVVAVLPPERMEDPVVLRLLLRGEYRKLVRPDAVVCIESDGLVGGKVLEIKPGKPPAEGGDSSDGPVAEDGLLRGDSSDLMEDMGVAVQGVEAGKGSLGKFATETEAHDAFVDLMHQGKKTLEKSEAAVTTLQQDADALKRLPMVGGYVEDPTALLQRYNCERDRRYYNAIDLFEPGKAMLTASGRQHLDSLGPWIDGTRRPGSDVVIVSYADPHADDPRAALVLTRQRSEAVSDYLKSKLGIQKLGWFSSRKVSALGMGVEAPPLPEHDPLPPERVEVQVFTP